jgi:hypothetical protein
VSDAGPPRPGRARRPLLQATAGMAAELVYVAALAGIGLMIAMAVSLFR